MTHPMNPQLMMIAVRGSLKKNDGCLIIFPKIRKRGYT